MHRPVVECALSDVCDSIFFVFVFTMTVTMKAWFRGLTAAFGTPAPAQTIAGMSLLVLTLYAGYAIPQPSMIGALKWITYINVSSFIPDYEAMRLTGVIDPQPLKYGFEGLIVNEFHSLHAECSTLIPMGPGYDGQVTLENQVCTTVGSRPGTSIVDGNTYVEVNFKYNFSHLWRVRPNHLQRPQGAN